MKKIILIGGAPTMGKSSVARQLSEALQIPWISTDTIREMMRQIVDKKRFPNLFHHQKMTAQQYLTSNTISKIVKLHIKENKEVWRAVKGLINTDYEWQTFIVEGVAIMPREAKQLMGKDKRVKAVFLTSSDNKHIRQVVFKRGLWDDADKYPDSVKEKEVDWVLHYNKYITSEAKRAKLPIITLSTISSTVSQIRKLL